MPLVNIEQLVKHYPMGKTKFTALKGIDLSFKKGEFTGLIGPSGSGKTTLLNIIGALDTPSEGSVTVLDKKIEKLSHLEAARLRCTHMGFIFQTYNLLPVYTVFENVEFPLLIMKMPEEQRKKMVLASLEWVGLMDKINSRPGQLSGGESQRVAVARAIVKQPDLVLADEPTANLDAANSYNILEMMVKLNRNLKTTFIFATHDEKVIGFLRRKIHLIDGRVAKDEPVSAGGK
jgi:putative ABC transport system ATP-binding protein